MVDIDRLKGEIVARKFTQKQVYTQIGLTKRKWELRMNQKKFDSDEIYAICNLLGDDLLPVFFKPEK